MEGFESTQVAVGDEKLAVAVAETPTQRRQGLKGVESLPSGLDGMLFVFPTPRSTSFNMRTVGLDLDIWWFDHSGTLVGSTQMTGCLDVECVSYPTPGEIMWALETPAGVFDFLSGSSLVFAG